MLKFLPLFALLTTCGPDETLTGYGDPDSTFVLLEIDRVPFPARATIRLNQPGRIVGDAPCNSYNAAQAVPYPWFETGLIRATRRACPDLASETAFFEALSKMTLSEVGGPFLILSNTDGGEMVFQAE